MNLYRKEKMSSISLTAVDKIPDNIVSRSRLPIAALAATGFQWIERFHRLASWPRCTSVRQLALRCVCAVLLFFSWDAHALPTEDRSCPDGKILRTFVESVSQASDMNDVRKRFEILFGPAIQVQSPAITASSCWTLKTAAEFGHPLRTIVLSLNDEMLEGEKNQLQPRVRGKYCLAEPVLTQNFKRLEVEASRNEPMLKKSTFDVPSSAFNRLMVHELNGCLIHIEFVAFQPRQ